MLIPLRAMQFRGGTSKGVYLLREDVEPFAGDLDAVLSALMGGAPRQIDGLGGNTTTTSKVAIVSPSAEDDIDVDYLFAQVDPETGALMFIALTIGSCFAVAVVVSEWAGVSMADAYLATTPGGIYGVLAIANEVHSGPIVVTLQVLRLVTMVLAAGMIPKIIGWLTRHQASAKGFVAEGDLRMVSATAQ